MAVFGDSSVERGEAEEKGRGKEGLRTTFIFRPSHTEGETRQQIGDSQLTRTSLKHSASVVSVFPSSALSLQFQFRSTRSVPMEAVLGVGTLFRPTNTVPMSPFKFHFL